MRLQAEVDRLNEELWDLSRSDSGWAPVIDEAAKSQEHDQRTTGQGTVPKPPVTSYGPGNVCCFTVPGTINAATQKEPDGWRKVW